MQSTFLSIDAGKGEILTRLNFGCGEFERLLKGNARKLWLHKKQNSNCCRQKKKKVIGREGVLCDCVCGACRHRSVRFPVYIRLFSKKKEDKASCELVIDDDDDRMMKMMMIRIIKCVNDIKKCGSTVTQMTFTKNYV